MGIPPNLLTKIFDPFFTTKEVGKGTGLGLSQVYGFAHQAGGTVRAESKVSQGTTITVYLPLMFGKRNRRQGRANQGQLASAAADGSRRR